MYCIIEIDKKHHRIRKLLDSLCQGLTQVQMALRIVI